MDYGNLFKAEPIRSGVVSETKKNDIMSDNTTVSVSKTYKKWQSMIDRGLEWFIETHPSTFFRRLKRGAPQEFRWAAWKALIRFKYKEKTLKQYRLQQTKTSTKRSEYHLQCNSDPTSSSLLPLKQSLSPNFVATSSSPNNILSDNINHNSTDRGDTVQNITPALSTLTMKQYLDLAEKECSFSGLIKIDVPRTFPEIESFDSVARQQLTRILNVFANHRPDVGYCQGMNFVAGFLLLISNFNELETFEILLGLMSLYCVEGLFKEHFPLLRRYVQVFDNIMEEINPELQQHFHKEGVLPPVYLHQWFLTLFVRGLPLRTSAVVWDYILTTGLHSMIVLSVALLKVLQRFLLHLNFEDAVKFLKSLKSSGRCDEGRIGRMLVKQADTTDIPKDLLKSIVNITPEDLILLTETINLNDNNQKIDDDDDDDKNTNINPSITTALVVDDDLLSDPNNVTTNPLYEYLAEHEDEDDDYDNPVSSHNKKKNYLIKPVVRASQAPDLLTGGPYYNDASDSSNNHNHRITSETAIGQQQQHIISNNNNNHYHQRLNYKDHQIITPSLEYDNFYHSRSQNSVLETVSPSSFSMPFNSSTDVQHIQSSSNTSCPPHKSTTTTTTTTTTSPPIDIVNLYRLM